MAALTQQGNSDVYYTPEYLCEKIINYFKPTGVLLEPCAGDGAFLKYMDGADWCEIEKGRDFLDYKRTDVDWAITNPPFSRISKQIIIHMYELGIKNIVLLMPVSKAIGYTGRNLDRKSYGYGIKEIINIGYPEGFPKAGFQMGVIHIQKNYSGPIKYGFKDWVII